MATTNERVRAVQEALTTREQLSELHAVEPDLKQQLAEVAEKIAVVPTDGANNRPLTDVKMTVKVIKKMKVDTGALQAL